MRCAHGRQDYVGVSLAALAGSTAGKPFAFRLGLIGHEVPARLHQTEHECAGDSNRPDELHARVERIAAVTAVLTAMI